MIPTLSSRHNDNLRCHHWQQIWRNVGFQWRESFVENELKMHSFGTNFYNAKGYNDKQKTICKTEMTPRACKHMYLWSRGRFSTQHAAAETAKYNSYDDVIKWKHLPCYWALCEGNPPVTGGFPSQRPVTRSFGVFFDLRLNKRLSKQSRRPWFETPSHSLWRHFNFNISRHLCTGDCPYDSHKRRQLQQNWHRNNSLFSG